MKNIIEIDGVKYKRVKAEKKRTTKRSFKYYAGILSSRTFCVAVGPGNSGNIKDRDAKGLLFDTKEACELHQEWLVLFTRYKRFCDTHKGHSLLLYPTYRAAIDEVRFHEISPTITFPFPTFGTGYLPEFKAQFAPEESRFLITGVKP